MSANIAYKYRLYPNKHQQQFFMRSFGCVRKIWNLMLEDAKQDYESTGSFKLHTPASYKEKYSYLKEIDSLALANAQLNLQQAFTMFRNKKVFGFPKFKSRNKSKFSYTTNNQHDSIRFDENNHIKLPKIGYVKVVKHRNAPADYKLKSATVSMERNGTFYVSVLYEYEANIKAVPVENTIGLDYSSECLYVDSNGNKGEPYKPYRKNAKRLAMEQHKLSRKQKGSRNYEKQKHKVAKVHVHISNVRKNSLHTKSAKIANLYDFVVVEDLNMRNLANKGFHNGKATLDNGYGMFLNMLEYKLKNRGKVFVRVGKFYPSSQLCHVCSYRNKSVKDLRIRKWECPVCHTLHNRDVNAAINILYEGLRLVG